MTAPARRRLAIVGGGIAGNYAAWRLRERYDVTLFEKGPRIGGHTNTIDVPTADGTLAVDTGFIVFNDWTYPLFESLLDDLGVASQPSHMGFAVTCERTGVEYSGTSFATLFARRRNALSPSFWGMLRDIHRFHQEGRRLLADDAPAGADYPLRELLERGRYGRAFVDRYLVPMGAAIWSTDPRRMLDFPARFFLRFFANHGLLSASLRPQWRVVAGGSYRYVEALSADWRDRIRIDAPVESVARTASGASVRLADGSREDFDGVVLACHSDEALAILEDPSDEERAILGAIPYQTNEAILHTDPRAMPARRSAWASWNYRIPPGEDAPRVVLTYCMNILQSLDTAETWLVTLNSDAHIAPERIHRRIRYAHPLFTPAGAAAQARHAEISGPRNTWYCGAWWRNGFHEDGVWSAARVCEQLGVAPHRPLDTPYRTPAAW